MNIKRFRLIKKNIFSFFLFFLLNTTLYSQKECDSIDNSVYRVLFLVDASNSMDKKWGKKSFWQHTQDVVEEFALSIEKKYNVEMGLRVSGYNFSLNENNCTDSKLLVPIRKKNANTIISKIKTIKNKGIAPLTYSLEKASDDLGCNSFKNIIIIITDGIENCDGDPCEVMKKLLDYRISIKPIILGLDVDNINSTTLECLGHFHNVKNINDYKSKLYSSFDKVTKYISTSIYLKSKNKDTSETNIGFTLFDKNKKPLNSYIHSLSKNSQPDSFILESLDSFSILINTIPKTFVSNLTLDKKIHNKYTIDVNLGQILFNSNSSILKSYLLDILLVNDTSNLGIFKSNNNIFIKEGSYTAIPKILPIEKINFSINSSNKKILNINPFCSINIVKDFNIIGDIYSNKNGIIEKIYNLSEDKTNEKILLYNGNYKIIYRGQKSLTIFGTFEKDFSVQNDDEKTIILK